MQVKITPSPLAGTVQLPPSKSFAIRALICSALAGGGSVAPLGTSADIAATVQALADLAAGRDEIFCNESGSLVRFLIPVAAALGKSVTFTGAGRLPRRPLDAFATLLPQHGVQVQTDGGLPFSVTGKLRPGQYEIAGNVSSQYLTGLLLALPLLDGDSAVLLTTELESKPYIDITLQVMAAFGVQVRPTDFGYLVRGNQQYKPADFTVESDWSHAAFFMAAGTVGQEIEIAGLNPASTHDRLCIPEIPVEDFVEAVRALVKVEQDWVPSEPDTSLYIRPFTIATEPVLGVKASSQYKFIIICSPSGAYYEEGLDPVNIYVEDEYVRATPGGTGYIKCGGNYAASIIASEKAHKLGFAQVLWLDGVERKYVEEVGSMNIMFKVDGEIYTAPTVGTVLPGITRMSCIELLKKWGYKVHEERFTIDFIMDAAKTGKLEEVFGTGTAAVISPVGGLTYEGDSEVINNGEIGEVTQKLYDTLTGIQFGKQADDMGWIVPVE